MSIFPDCLKGHCGSVMRWCVPCFFSSLILWDSTWHTQHNGRRVCCASPLHMGQSIMGCHNSSHHRREETEGARAGRSSQEHVPQQGPTSDILPPPSCTVLFWVHQGIDPSIRSQSHDVVACGNTLTNTRGSVLRQSPRCPLIQPSLQLSSFGGFVIHRWPLGKTVVDTQKEKLSSPGGPDTWGQVHCGNNAGQGDRLSAQPREGDVMTPVEGQTDPKGRDWRHYYVARRDKLWPQENRLLQTKQTPFRRHKSDMKETSPSVVWTLLPLILSSQISSFVSKGEMHTRLEKMLLAEQIEAQILYSASCWD